MSKISSPKVLKFGDNNTFNMHDNTINIHLGQLGIANPLIPNLFPHGFMIKVTVDPQGTPILTNLGEFPLIIYNTVDEGGLETSIVLQNEHVELKMEEDSHFAVTVFTPIGNPVTMVIYLKVWSILNTNNCNYALTVYPKLVC